MNDPPSSLLSVNTPTQTIGKRTIANTAPRLSAGCECKAEITSLKNQLELLKKDYENLEELTSYLRYRSYKLDVQNLELRKIL